MFKYHSWVPFNIILLWNTRNDDFFQECLILTLAKKMQILSYVNIMLELIVAYEGFKIIQNLYKNEITEFIFYISTIDII